MNRKDWVQTLLSLGLVLPGVAQAIGLGNLVVLSGPGEPFQAEIPIHSAHPKQLAGLEAQLADPSAYAMIHLPVAQATQNWQFSVRPGDNPAILINSSTPLAPGATPFLVQLDWAGGQMVREYQAYPGAYNVPKRTALATPAAVASNAQMPQAPAPTSNGWTNRAHYGPVPAGASLYQIAQQLNQNPRLSQQQAMAALFKANPAAFLQGDPSRLLAGVVLRVPGIREVEALSPMQAATLLHRKEQTEAATASTAAPTPATASASSAPSAPSPASPSGVATALSLTSAPAVSAAKTAVATSAVTPAVSAAPVVAPADQAKIDNLQHTLQGVEARLSVAQQQLASQAMQIAKMSRDTGSTSFPPLLWVSLGGNLLLLLLFVWMYRRQEQAAARQREISSKLTTLGTTARAPAPAPAPAPIPTPIPVPAMEPTITPKPVADTDVSEPAIVSSPAVTSGIGATPMAAAADVDEEDDRDSFEVDPLEQADLYQTYGKTEQAMNVLQEALEVNPRRREVYVRLLGLYADADRRGDFLDLAERMRSRFGPNNAEWQEIAGKGRELFPSNALFLEETAVPESSSTAESPAVTVPEAASEADEQEVEPEKLDFDFGSWGHQEEPVQSEEEPAWTDAHRKMLEDVNEQFRALDEGSEPGLSLASEEPASMAETAPAEHRMETELGVAVPAAATLATAADWDAIGTKLDLAKAYVEMGDGDAARELLEEIRRDGNPEQQSEAEKLVAGL